MSIGDINEFIEDKNNNFQRPDKAFTSRLKSESLVSKRTRVLVVCDSQNEANTLSSLLNNPIVAVVNAADEESKAALIDKAIDNGNIAVVEVKNNEAGLRQPRDKAHTIIKPYRQDQLKGLGQLKESLNIKTFTDYKKAQDALYNQITPEQKRKPAPAKNDSVSLLTGKPILTRMSSDGGELKKAVTKQIEYAKSRLAMKKEQGKQQGKLQQQERFPARAKKGFGR